MNNYIKFIEELFKRGTITNKVYLDAIKKVKVKWLHIFYCLSYLF